MTEPLQTLVIVGGIAIGVGVIVFMSAMLSGLQAEFHQARADVASAYPAGAARSGGAAAAR
ncbi:MAG: hypothetical protein MZV49_24660 [Rhodopseudomonas palustris]|nr:hypothetical protein [Rhodopseudomonas palustris]